MIKLVEQGKQLTLIVIPTCFAGNFPKLSTLPLMSHQAHSAVNQSDHGDQVEPDHTKLVVNGPLMPLGIALECSNPRGLPALAPLPSASDQCAVASPLSYLAFPH